MDACAHLLSAFTDRRKREFAVHLSFSWGFLDYHLHRDGSMIGAIAGDIIGSVYEVHPVKTKDFPLFHPRCRFTDDSVLTLR